MSSRAPKTAPRSRKRTEDVSTVLEAQEVRQRLLSDFSSVLRALHDPQTASDALRDFNDRANRLLKARRAWEYRIRELGGPNYLQKSALSDSEAVSVNGYRYFGRSKDLPDVQRLLEQQQQQKKHQTVSVKSKEQDQTLKIDKFNSVKFDKFYYNSNRGDAHDDSNQSCSSKLFSSDEEKSLLDEKVIEKAVIECKREQLIAKLQQKEKLMRVNEKY